MKKLILAALGALSMAGTAIADPIYIDVGTDYGGNNANTAAGDTTTGWKDQLTVAYQSSSIVDDLDGSGTFSAGDTIISRGGLVDANVINDNLITDLLPTEVAGLGPSNNDYGNSWVLSFRFTDLVGVHDGFDFQYQSGNIDFLLFDSNNGIATEVHLFTMSLSNHVSGVGGAVFNGVLNNFGAGTLANGKLIADIFNTPLGSFGDAMEVQWRLDQNVDLPVIGGVSIGTGAGGSNQLIIDNNEHDGSLRFQVPEPNMIVLFGLGLLGLARVARKKAK